MSETENARGRARRGVRSRWPGAGLAVAVVAGAAWGTHGLWLAHSSPTSVHQAPTPTPLVSPTPTVLPLLAAADRLDLGPDRAYGAIDIVGTDRGPSLLDGYVLATPPANLPVTLPVWRLRGFLSADVKPLASSLSLPVIWSPSPGAVKTTFGGIDQAHASVYGNIRWSAGHQVMTDEDAVASVAAVFQRLGIPPLDGDPQVYRYTGDPSGPQWTVSFMRRPVMGERIGLTDRNAILATAQISQDGTITNMGVDEMALDGGSNYALRPWRDAWNDVRRGRFFDSCCYAGTGGGPPPTMTFLRVDKVEVVYEPVDSGATRYLVPFYAFKDSRGDMAVDVPALRLSDLSEPGGFRIVEPS